MRFTKRRVALVSATIIAVFAIALSTRQSKIVPYARAQSQIPGSYIKHIIVIMQENRSFDSYFGTFPGADGIPMKNGHPAVCVPDPKSNRCVEPYHDTNDSNVGGPHYAPDATADIDNGKMDGFISDAEAQQEESCFNSKDPACIPDLMGYHDGGDIPNYWAYARAFVLQDRMFEPNASWSLPRICFCFPSGRPNARPTTTHRVARIRSMARICLRTTGRTRSIRYPFTRGQI